MRLATLVRGAFIRLQPRGFAVDILNLTCLFTHIAAHTRTDISLTHATASMSPAAVLFVNQCRHEHAESYCILVLQPLFGDVTSA